MIDRDSRGAFVLVNPGVAVERREIFFLRVFQFLQARFGAFLFVIRTAGRRFHDDEREQTKEREKEHDAEPGREHPARLIMLKWFFGWHG